MKRILLAAVILSTLFSSCSQHDTGGNSAPRPKLVVGIVVDQMRWDYLYRYNDRYSAGGFKRLMKDGFNCQNTMVNYVPTFTAPGHTCIYTGSVPSIHGIAANDWIDNFTHKPVYCVDDSTVHPVGGGDNTGGSMSPRNLLVTTVTDELRLATNQQSRVYGIAIKDRGAILPAGHLANGAYWFDDSTGNFCSSTYYANASPQWLKDFNGMHWADKLMKNDTGWQLMYAPNTYSQSLTDANAYEKPFSKEKAPVFPHRFDSLTGKDLHYAMRSAPAGNTITLRMAEACIDGEKLGQGKPTDFLCVSLSSTDYAGHQFGPNSIEVEDMYLKLDKEIANFLSFLDKSVGKGNYLLFLTADHGAAHNANYLSDEDVPAGTTSPVLLDQLNQALATQFKAEGIVSHMMNYQLYLDDTIIAKAKLDKPKIKDAIYTWLTGRPEIEYVADFENIQRSPIPQPILEMLVNGYNRNRSGCMGIVMNPGWYDGKATGTTHGTWQPYDAHIPLLWYGWHIPKGDTHETVHMTDIAATLAALLHIQMPNGCVGRVITSVVK